MHNRFARTEQLYGPVALAALARARVAVIGIGGVGSYAAEALARSGIGSLILVDNDSVDVTNINRQIWALESTVGIPKVQVARQRLLDINPAIKITAVQDRFCAGTAEAIISPRLDFVVDAIDSVPDKIELLQHCLAHDIPIITCMGAARRTDPTRIQYGDLLKITGCPLARTMRKALTRLRLPGPIPAVYSQEPARPVEPGMPLPSGCMVPAAAGMAAAAYVVSVVTGTSSPESQIPR